MKIKEFHFHIYFEPGQINQVNELVQQLQEFSFLKIGRIWDRPVGPHPVGSCQILVKQQNFYEMVLWFMKNRKDLSLFIHPISGNDWLDHTDYVMWLGRSYEVKVEMFKD